MISNHRDKFTTKIIGKLTLSSVTSCDFKRAQNEHYKLTLNAYSKSGKCSQFVHSNSDESIIDVIFAIIIL